MNSSFGAMCAPSDRPSTLTIRMARSTSTVAACSKGSSCRGRQNSSGGLRMSDRACGTRPAKLHGRSHNAAKPRAMSGSLDSGRAAALVPNDEEMLRRLITLLDELGDRAGAMQVYEEFARRVAGDYEVKPAPETTALISSVRTRDAARAAPERLPIALAGSAEIPAARGAPTPSMSRLGRPG